jgi:acetylornithine/succinyldiaminopimelate/putrescine aminotransferase
MSVLEESSRPEFLENVTALAVVFKEGFIELQRKHPNILTGLRQLGLMMGIEMVHDTCGPVLTKCCYDHGILAIYANNNKRVCQLLPPLIIDRKTANEILEGVDGALRDAAAFLGL